jgi:hypothetical protein
MKKCTGTGSKSDKKQIKPTPLQEPHVLGAEDVLQNHATSAGQGLSAAEAAQRGHTHGPNELAETARKTAWLILLDRRVTFDPAAGFHLCSFFQFDFPHVTPAVGITGRVCRRCRGHHRHHRGEKAVPAQKTGLYYGRKHLFPIFWRYVT